MIRIEGDRLAELLPYEPLARVIERMFVEGCVSPQRSHHSIIVPGAPEATLLLMPAWIPGGYLGVKIAGVFPGNRLKGAASVAAQYLLMSATNGTPLALIDGGELTARRTAATSALAGARLARESAKRHLIVGTGRLSAHLAAAHGSLRPNLEVEVWGRSHEKAKAVAAALVRQGMRAVAVSDLQAACERADIISCATLSKDPLVAGAWLKPGTHLDLVGSFTPDMREVDDEAVARASVFCDTMTAACESGDLEQPIGRNVIERSALVDLARLLGGAHPGRRDEAEITLFKSVGCALEDLAAAMLAYEGARHPS